MAPPVADVSVQEFANLVGLTSQRIYQFIQQGLPHRKRKKDGTRIVPKEGIRWIIEHDRAEAKSKEDTGEADEKTERALKIRAERMREELKLAKELSEVVPADLSQEFIGNFLGGFAAVAAGQLGRFERAFVRCETPAEARLLKQKIHRALMEGARDYAEQLEQAADQAESEATTAEPPAQADDDGEADE